MPEFLFWGGETLEDEYTEERPEEGRAPGDMHEPPPYTGDLDYRNDGSELLHPFVD